jgi:hypothetical protein
MDRLRRRLSRANGHGREPQPEQPTTQEPSGKAGGHGDHWGCILRASEETDLLGFLGRVVSEVERPEMFGGVGVGMAACSQGDKLRACVLVVNDRLVTAYPQAVNGPVWPITLREITPWANGVEGQVTGSCHGAEISFFDTRFYANQRRYKIGETYSFHMGALAYSVGRAADVEMESDIGAKVSLEGAHAYMPASIGNEGAADIDDYWFHSPLDGPTAPAELVGRNLTLYPVTLALPDEFEMRVDLYAASHVVRPEMETTEQDSDLDGFLWLQGYLSE